MLADYPILYLLDQLGVAVFALSGALMAAKLRMDPFGVLVLATSTAIGGGTIRDLTLNLPVFWVEDPLYILVIALTAVLTMLLVNHAHRIPPRLLLFADAGGLALFTILGAQKALLHDAPGIIAVVMGMMTGVAGGMIRDILCRQIPMVLQKEVYATASLLGGMTFVLISELKLSTLLCMIIGMLVTFAIRCTAIIWHLQLPAFQLDAPDNDN